MNVAAMDFDRRLRQQARQGCTAPFALLRAATLPFDAIDALRLRRTERLLATICDAERAMETARLRLEAVLHDLVPHLENEKKLRRDVVNLRRDVHHNRGTGLAEARLDAVAECIALAADQAVFAEWRAAQSRRREALAALEDAVVQETQEILRPALRAPLAEPQFARAIALANPRTARAAESERKLPRTPWPDKLERSLLGYLARASVKTSPFSSFMSVSTLAVDGARAAAIPHAARPRLGCTATLNRGLVSQFDRLSRTEAARSAGLPLAVNSTLRPLRGGRFAALCNEDVVIGGRAWSEQRLAQFRLGGALAEVLDPGASATWTGWIDRFAAAGVDAAEAENLVRSLLERGVLVVPPVADAFTADPLGALRERWRASGSRQLSVPAEQLECLAATLDGFAEADAGERLVRIASAEATAEAVRSGFAGVAGRRPPEPLSNVITEDCWLDGVEGSLGRELLEPLADLEDFLASQVSIAPAYLRLERAFVERFGTGGRCDHVVDFLTKAAPLLVDMPEFGARLVEEMPVAAPEGALIPVSAHLQIARNRLSGETEFVMNRVFDGSGWLAARFTRSEWPQARALARDLTRWLRVVAEGAEPVDLPISGQASDLQAHAPLTERVLGWPGEPVVPGGPRVIDPAELRLRHDAATGLLSLSDADGAPISLQYLGNTFPNPAWGVRYALSLLSRPFALARPSIGRQDGVEDQKVHFRPALRHGRVVLQRPTWWVSSAYLREIWLTGTQAEQLLSVARDVERLGMPPCLYAQIHVPLQNTSLIAHDALDAYRKPIWLDTRNPFWLAMLERLTRRSDWILLSPPYPGPDDLWFTVAGKPHVTEIHLELMVRAGRRGARMS